MQLVRPHLVSSQDHSQQLHTVNIAAIKTDYLFSIHSLTPMHTDSNIITINNKKKQI